MLYHVFRRDQVILCNKTRPLSKLSSDITGPISFQAVRSSQSKDSSSRESFPAAFFRSLTHSASSPTGRLPGISSENCFALSCHLLTICSEEIEGPSKLYLDSFKHIQSLFTSPDDESEMNLFLRRPLPRFRKGRYSSISFRLLYLFPEGRDEYR